jgi:glutamyl-tRNA synthetase
MSQVPPAVTRFAPSPTGSLHIGGARTALFNLLYARHTQGRFLLRIEDTDRERSTPENVQVILDGLGWLGVVPDAEPVFQFARAERHHEVVLALLSTGAAYRCYMSVEEAEAAKAAARLEGHALRSPWRDRSAADAPPGAPFVVRFRIPDADQTVIDDLVRGAVAFPNKDLEDLVLLRTDGAATYNLAVTVDDHDMGVTHIIRGEEHLSNAARQSLLAEAMAWPRTTFAHIPLIHGPDGQKLSKRHGAQAVGEFAAMGYLPEALRNYLARLGWGHGDAEIFSDAQAADWFDVRDVVKAPARLDWAKLNHINQHYIRIADDERLAGLVANELAARISSVVSGAPAPEGRLAFVISLVKDGAQTLVQLADMVTFALVSRPLALDAKIMALLTSETRARLARLAEHLSGQSEWSLASLEQAIRAFAASEGVGVGKFGAALRGVLSGGAPAPDLASTLMALGPDEALARLEEALSLPQ